MGLTSLAAPCLGIGAGVNTVGMLPSLPSKSEDVCCQVTIWIRVASQVTPPPWVAPSMPPVRFQPVARPQAHRCPLGQVGPPWMVPIPKLWDSRTGARLRLTRTSCISSEPRSWRTRCWPGGSPFPTTCRWRCRGSGRCPGCSSRCQHYLHPLCPRRDLAPGLALALARVRDQHLQITTGLTVGPTLPCVRGWEGDAERTDQDVGGDVHRPGLSCPRHPSWSPHGIGSAQGAQAAGLPPCSVLPLPLPPWPPPPLSYLRRGACCWLRPLEPGLPVGVGAGVNTGCLRSSCLFLLMCRYGRAQHAPPRTLRSAPWDARSAPRRASQALA